MEKVAGRLHHFLCKRGHVLVMDQSAAEIEIRLNGCPASCVDETNPQPVTGQVISLSAANIDLAAPDEDALIRWLQEKIEEITK
jgi:hypothetical protein